MLAHSDDALTRGQRWRHALAVAGAWASLASLTAMSAAHTAAAVCSIEAPEPGRLCSAGIIAAVALEVGALALAYAAAHAYATTGRHSGRLWFGVLALSAVATFANLDTVGAAVVGPPFTLDKWAALDTWQAAKVGVLAAAWPLLAVFLASTVESLAGNAPAPAPRVEVLAEPEPRRPARQDAASGAARPPARSRQDPRPAKRGAAVPVGASMVDRGKAATLAAMLARAAADPSATLTDVARDGGMIRQTARNWLDKMAAAGMVAGDAGAWRVTETGRAFVAQHGAGALAAGD